MTQDPTHAGLSPNKVAELERKLAEAAAEVARVQAELQQALHAGDPPPPVGAPTTTIPPYAAQGTSPYVSNPEPREMAAPLADPPRHVPMTYRFATFNLSVYELFILAIGFIAPIAVWAFFPVVIPAALIAAVLVIGWFRGRRYVGRMGILKWGKVATVTNNDTLDKGTYYSGVTYNNMRKRTATGWNAKTIWYSGPAYKNKVDYILDGATGSLEWRGLRYQQGVILADSRKPSRAMEVSMFPYSVKPGPDGQLTGELPAWLWGGIISTLVVEVTVVYLAVQAVLDLWVNR